MKLRQVTDHHLNSGIGRYSFELSRALIGLDHQTHLSKLYKKNGDDNYFDGQFEWIEKIRYRSFRNFHPYLLPYFIASHLLGKQAAIYHGHWFMAGLGLIKAKKRHKVITMHDVSLLHEKEREGSFLRYYEQSLNTFARLKLPIIMVSESAKKDALTYSNLDETHVYTVHNGINFNQFYPKTRAENSEFQLVYAGGLSPRKNLELLLEACHILESRNFSYQLQVAGNHPERTPYPEMARSLGLKNVSFIGFIADDQMNDFYNHADLFVYTSKYEGFGFAPLEAMATKTAVICTKGGSLEEISGGGAELIAYNAEMLAEAIISMKEDTDKRTRQAEIGHKWVQQYTWKKCAEKTVELYKKILE